MLMPENSLLVAWKADKTHAVRRISCPLDEETAYQQLDAYFTRQANKQTLADFTRIDDDKLLGRLVDAGFTTNTLPALQLVPIALMAWASDSVTEAECRAVVAAIYEAHLIDQPAAAARVQSWLDRRPAPELRELWADYTNCRLSGLPKKFRQTMARQLLRQATQVAIASGGYMGFGAICKAENQLLDAIREVFYSCD